jgi:hypothetical protein
MGVAEFRAKFEKQEISVGLSVPLPIGYQDPDGKYLAADQVEPSIKVNFRKEVFSLEINGTSVEMTGLSPSRLRCYRLVMLLPEASLLEAEGELVELAEHYKSIEQAKAAQAKSLPSSKSVVAKVDRIVKL